MNIVHFVFNLDDVGVNLSTKLARAWVFRDFLDLKTMMNSESSMDLK